MKLGEFKSDPKKEVDGIVYNFDEDSYVRVARANNKPFLAAVRRSGKELRRRYRKKVPEEAAEVIVKQAFAKHILLEICGFVDDAGDIVGKGKKIKDTYANRLKIVQSDSYKDFVDFVSDLSTDEELYKAAMEDDELGKSQKTSSGNSLGVEKKAG